MPTLIEPFVAPLIPVSGIGLVTPLPGSRVCLTFFHEVPNCDPKGPPIEHHVVARLLWPTTLLHMATDQFPAMLARAEAGMAAVSAGVGLLAH